jgi:hypothetical protein
MRLNRSHLPKARSIRRSSQKGQAENQVGLVRERFFTPRLRFTKTHRHPELLPYARRFDDFHTLPASVSKTCLVRFDTMTLQSTLCQSRS